jgi:hypothetical protein
MMQPIAMITHDSGAREQPSHVLRDVLSRKAETLPD